ncbi:MAG: DUF4912 domain-containing protein [Myxococcota bacterium]
MKVQDLKKMKKSELLVIAKKLGVKGFSRLTKKELIMKLFDFVNEGGKALQEKTQELIKKIKINPPRKRRRTGLIKAVNKIKDSKAGKQSEKKARASQKNKKSDSTSSKKSEVGNQEPANTIDNEAKARTQIESMRYMETPVFANGNAFSPAELREIDKDLPDLPIGYGDDEIHLMPRDPQWMFCYWDICEETRQKLGKGDGAQIYMKLHDITNIEFNGSNSWSIHQFILNETARWWYIPVPGKGKSFISEIGYLHDDGRWNSIGFSNPASPPPGRQSSWVHDVFITLPFDKPLPLFQKDKEINWLGSSIPSREGLFNLPKRGSEHSPAPFQLQSDRVNLSSPGMATVSSFISFQEGEKVVNKIPFMESDNVTFKGITSPGTEMFINGDKITVQTDGTFTFTIPFGEKYPAHKLYTLDDDGNKNEWTITLSD